MSSFITFAVENKEDNFYKETPAKLIDTRLNVPNELWHAFSIGYWVDEDSIIVNAESEDKDINGRPYIRAMLYDLRIQQSREILKNFSVSAWDTEKGCAAFGGKRKDVSEHNLWFAKINKEGHILEMHKETPEEREVKDVVFKQGKYIDPLYCGVYYPKNLNRWEKNYYFLRLEDGYFERDKSDRDLPTIWRRPDGTSQELDMPYAYKNNLSVRYLPFLKKYQINDATCLFSNLKCPPDIVLMSKDGVIEQIKLPNKILEHAPWISNAYKVRDGVLLDVGNEKKGGFYLWRDEKLYKLWSRPGRNFLTGERSFTGNETLSPDGCKVAFFKADSQKSARKIYILNICERIGE
jgi:hypothetical protein